MTALGPGISTQDRTTGWADIKPNLHPENRLRVLAYDAWKLASKLADEDYPDWHKIEQMQATARELEKLADEDAECSCTPRQDCRLCNLTASVIYDEERG
jgi:hypothetical protein